MKINVNTKIAILLKQHPEALEAIVRVSPKFNKLRNPILRKVIAGRTSISMAYLAGFVLFCGGILAQNQIVLQAAAVLLLISSILYNWNVIRLLLHKPAVL
ncbi:MAG TPA: DUF1858 domain-containing protein [Sediminibacterium sp.]|nr:DUF1858 domain-containing protein [Sediminibacterium sp.]